MTHEEGADMWSLLSEQPVFPVIQTDDGRMWTVEQNHSGRCPCFVRCYGTHEIPVEVMSCQIQ